MSVSAITIQKFCSRCKNYHITSYHSCPQGKPLRSLYDFSKSWFAEITENLVNEAKEEQIIRKIDLASTSWTTSSQNIRLQDYGPKIDFKAKKVDSYDEFTGLPTSSTTISTRISDVIPDFAPNRLRILEYCQKIGEKSLDSEFYDHSFLFTDRMAIVSNEVQLEYYIPARSCLVATGDLSFKRMLVRPDEHLTRCLLLVFNELRPEFSSHDRIQYFQNGYKGLSISRFAQLDRTINKNLQPAFLNRLVDHHITPNDIKHLVSLNYGHDIDKCELYEQHRSVSWQCDKNFTIEVGGKQLWAKLTVQSPLVNETLVKKLLDVQQSAAQCLQVPDIIPTKFGDLFVKFQRTREHYLWLMYHNQHIALSERPTLSNDRKLRICIGQLLRRFHMCANGCPLNAEADFVNELELHYMTDKSVKRDKEMLLNRLFTISDDNRRSMLMTSIELLDKIDLSYCHKVIGHLAFGVDTVHLRVDKIPQTADDLCVGHFAHVRYTCVIVDLLLCALRFHTTNESLIDVIADIIEGYGRIDEASADVVYELVFGLMAACMLNSIETSLALSAEEDRNKAAMTMRDDLEQRFEFFEKIYNDRSFKDMLRNRVRQFV
ncbi:hypothetical protein ACOME3_003553 [Neoechinorhynchus agilis]